MENAIQERVMTRYCSFRVYRLGARALFGRAGWQEGMVRVLMYFDFRTWLKLVQLAAHESSPRRRFGLYIRLLIRTPLVALFTAVCFFLDPILFPGLRRTEVRAPVFVIGHARSGTTLMHRLMSEDRESFSVFKYWELFAPSLLQKKIVHWLAALDRSFFGGALERRVRASEQRKFGATQHIHRMGYTIPEEDDFLFMHSCASGGWIVALPYIGELDFYHVDRRPAKSRARLMNYYRECVRRQIYLNGGNRIHLSKNPLFCGRVESLIETFPDARFVLLYRNPYETIPSLLKLMKVSWKMRHFDEERIRNSLAVLASMSCHNYTWPLEVLARHPATRFSVVDYRALVSAPEETVRQVYSDIGLEPGAAFAARLALEQGKVCLLYTSPSPRDRTRSRMPSSA